MPRPGEFGLNDPLTSASVNALSGGVFGYAQATANQSSITEEVDLTGLSVTVDVPAGRRIKITGNIRYSVSNADNVALLRIKGNGSTLQIADLSTSRTSGGSLPTLQCIVVVAPIAATFTFKLTLAMGAGTGSVAMAAAINYPAFILVEDVGPA